MNDPVTMEQEHRRQMRKPLFTLPRLLIAFGLALTVLAFFLALSGWPCRKAHASLPGVIFSGEKPLSVWQSESSAPGMTWEQLTAVTCAQEQGFLAVTIRYADEDLIEDMVFFTCVLRPDTRPRQEA